MTKAVVTGADYLFGPWFAEQIGQDWLKLDRGVTVGLLDQTKGPVAVSYFANCNGASVMMHCAGLGKNWLNREFLWYSFYYPFEQLKVRKILSPVESDNLACVKFITHLGFRLEATFKNASPKGDLLVFSLEKADCRWLNLKERYRGQAQCA